jgi:hypothetical protein
MPGEPPLKSTTARDFCPALHQELVQRHQIPFPWRPREGAECHTARSPLVGWGLLVAYCACGSLAPASGPLARVESRTLGHRIDCLAQPEGGLHEGHRAGRIHCRAARVRRLARQGEVERLRRSLPRWPEASGLQPVLWTVLADPGTDMSSATTLMTPATSLVGATTTTLVPATTIADTATTADRGSAFAAGNVCHRN